MTSRSLYDEILLEHNAHPVHRGELPDANVLLETVNDSCGDRLTFDLQLEDGVVVDGKFGGVGCAISLAAADLMLGAMIGKKVAEIEVLRDKYEKLVVGEQVEMMELGELAALSCVARMPARVKCAKLPWQVVDTLSEEHSH